MKKNNVILLILALALGALTIYFVNRNESSSIRTELMDFAVKDSASITKIFLADRNGNSVLLKRKDIGTWTLNDSFPPRPDMLKNLLEVVYAVSVKSRVPKSGFNNVINSLAAGGIKCEVYLKDEQKPFKVYYVGGQTADALGTFMMLDNSTVPFVMEIPGFNGYLTPWYDPHASDWIEPVVFRCEPGQIMRLTLNYPSFPERSFILEKAGDKYLLQKPAESKTIKDIDSVAVENYLSLYRQVFYEVREEKMSPAQRDSLLKTQPLNEIELQTQDGLIKRLSIFPMPISESSMTIQDSLGNPLKYDVDRMYGFMHDKKEWVVIQHYSFDKLFRKGDDFLFNKSRRSIQSVL